MSEMRPGLRRRTLLSGLSALGFAALAPEATARAADSGADAEIEALVARMSVAEKAGQLSLYPDPRGGEWVGVNPATVQRDMEAIEAMIRAGQVTGLFNGVGVEGARRLQKVAVEESPSKIPLIFAADVVHGLHTQFPCPLGEAASFEPALAERTARAAAQEATARGVHWTFAPMVDVARDQRWGRVVEGAGEDTLLGARFAAARVRGFQGKRLSAQDSLLACPKHFVGYGAVAGGMEYASVDISEPTLREVHFPPFKAALDSGALSVMSAFNDVNGVPASANRKLLTGVLREEWGFRGLVLSDYTADAELVAHGYAADPREAVKLAITAGVDVSMASGLYNAHLTDLVASGEVSMDILDAAVRRVLYVKRALGLFDDPYRSMDAGRERREVHTPATHALAREAARRSIVMLKNEGPLLPLPRSGKRIALIGPFGADTDNLYGPWSMFGTPGRGVSLEYGLSHGLENSLQLTTVKGCEIEAAIPGGIEAARVAAFNAEIVVLALGESAGMSGEAQSRTSITLPAAQAALAEAVVATGRPVVVVLKHGRALALNGAVLKAQAILATWFLGAETGTAIADILLGVAGPSGRLPVSFPYESGQEPYVYNHRSTGRPQLAGEGPMFKARWRETGDEALFAFGHGLTYGDIRYEAFTLSAETLAWDGTLTARVRVTNAGTRPAEEVVQLYLHDQVASLTPPVRRLIGFSKVKLAAGQSQDVTFTVTTSDLAFIGADLKPVAEPGMFDLWAAPSAAAGLKATFRLLGPKSPTP